MPNTVIVQKWEESERGWGTRPDGYSLHLTEKDRRAYVDGYWADQTRRSPEPPDEYSRLCGSPYTAEVDDATYAEVKATANGLRRYTGDLPGSGGSDGWVPMKRGTK